MQTQSSTQPFSNSNGKTVRPVILVGAIIGLLVGLLVYSNIRIGTLKREVNRQQILLREANADANKLPLGYEKGYQDAIWEKYLGEESYRIELNENNELSIWQKKAIDPLLIKKARDAGLLPKEGERIDELPTP